MHNKRSGNGTVVNVVGDFSPQVDQSHRECDELSREVRKKEQEIERAHQDKIIELEKVGSELPNNDSNI